MKAVLVTGGAGYIGSHVCLALLEAGERVVILDDLSSGAKEPHFDGAIFVKGKIEDEALVANIIKEHDIDAIIHMAAFIKVEESVENPEKYQKNNAENTRILLDTAVKNGVKYFVFSSSAAVYGAPKHNPVSEKDEAIPMSPYGDSKLAAEKFVEKAPITSVILRYFNVAGADPHGRAGYDVQEKHTHLIRRAIRSALNDEEMTIFGNDYDTHDGTPVRDYIHVSDLATAHVQALKHARAGKRGTFNYGYGKGYSVKEVVESVGRVAGKKMKVKYGDRRAGDPPSIVADNSRIKRELNIRPEYDDLDTIIEHELEWVRSQQK